MKSAAKKNWAEARYWFRVLVAMWIARRIGPIVDCVAFLQKPFRGVLDKGDA